ncbi:MAG: hypothetical protein HYX92_10940 [Chloroflexi bacterium]|nr:hypothetical protein [Chloroflexota bacterium]
MKKLLIKPGQRVLVLNGPKGYALGELPEGVVLSDKPQGVFDQVHAFCRDSAEFQKLAPQAVAALAPKGILWMSYPKGSSKMTTDLNRDILWKLAGEKGLTGVSLVSIDDRWSAMRFKPAEK